MENDRKLKIAMIGHKDIQNNTGGIEVMVGELSARLTADGYDVTAYARGLQKGHNVYDVDGVHVRRIFTLKRSAFNATIYSFLATFDALFRGYDVIHYHALGPSVPLAIAHLFGKRTVCTVHGLNWRVDKWGRFAKFYMHLGEKVAAKFADEVVVLSEEDREYFKEEYGRDTLLIPNAINPLPEEGGESILEHFGLEKNGYIVYVGRMSPEKGVSELVGGFANVDTDKKLVLAGNWYESEYCENLKKQVLALGNRVIVAGNVSRDHLKALYSGAAAFCLPSHTEGLSLSLLEAMSVGTPCFVSDIRANTDVVKKFGHSFVVSDKFSLAVELEKYLNELSKKETTGELARQKENEIRYVKDTYSYDLLVQQYEDAYSAVAKKKSVPAKEDQMVIYTSPKNTV